MRHSDPSTRHRVRLLHVTTVPQSLYFFLAGQVRYMKSRGMDVSALSSPGHFLEMFAASEDVPLYAVTMRRRITPVRDLIALFRLWRHLRRIRPHIVHAHTPKGGLLGMIAGWLAGVPIRIYHIHGLPLLSETGLKRVILRRTERISCGLSHQVLCVSESVRSVAVSDGLCPEDRIKVPPPGSINGVDATGRFCPDRVDAESRERIRRNHGIPSDALLVGFVGRIARDKGMSELAQAWRTLRERFASLHLLIVAGPDPHDPVPPEVERQFREDDRTHLAGHVSDTPPFYAAMDVLVLPTYREGFPLTLLEAAAMALPIVATRVPGCVDAVVDGVTGLLVPVRDARALSGAIQRYLENPGLRRQHGLAGRQRVLREFRQEPLWEALFDEYARLLAEKGLPLPEPAASGFGVSKAA